jgi:hypothetical protein
MSWGIVWKICVGFVADIDITPLGAEHAFLRQQHMRREGGGRSYLFLPGFFSMYDAIHERMTKWMDGQMNGGIT